MHCTAKVIGPMTDSSDEQFQYHL